MSEKCSFKFEQFSAEILKGKEFPQGMFIEASAGTGKTFTVKKLVSLLVKKGTPLNKILIVTYTEKATGELRDRIRNEIKTESANESLTENEKKYLEDALREVDNAPIFTIHSFCQKSLRDNAFEAGQAFSVEMIDDAQAIAEFIQGKIRDEWVKEDDFAELAEKYESNDKLQEDLVSYFKSGIINYFDGVEIDEVSLDVNEKIHQFVLKRIQPLYKEWKTYKKEHGLQSFNDMIDSVREKVKETAFKTALQNQYQYAIIDEFQDTNLRQWDIFKTLFLDSPEHHIIVVGDPKQSIYSFQGADVGVYSQAVAEIAQKGCGYKLPNNYRSTNSMIDACNVLFGDGIKAFDFGKGIIFSKSSYPEDNKDIKAEPTFDEKPILPFQISEPVNEDSFAELAVKKIIEFATYVGKGKNAKTRLQVFDKKDPGKLRNVTFNDFAILARTRTEMEPIEAVLRKYGVPHLRYKDKNLFGARECLEWIALFQALNASDFTGFNVRYLNEVLITDFFDIPITDVENEEYSRGDSNERILLQIWKNLIEKRQFAQFLESVFEKSKITKKLGGVTKLQEYSKIKQIGDYAIDYLYNNHVSIDKLILHLLSLYKNEENADVENGNLVAKSSDFNAVQIMTIHASKGLEFPVVISVAGFKRRDNKAYSNTSIMFHDSTSKLKLGLDEVAKKTRKDEEKEEWQRLFYVNFTRASSILILPRYSKKDKKSKDKYFADGLEFLKKAFVDDFKNLKEVENLVVLEREEKIWRTRVKEILNQDSKCDEQNNNAQHIKSANEKLPFATLKSHSYSSLAHGEKHSENIFNNDGKNARGQNGEENSTDFNKAIDGEGKVFQNGELNGIKINQNALNDYPRGVSIGNVIHNTLESLCNNEVGLNFGSFQSDVPEEKLNSLERAQSNEILRTLIKQNLKKEGLYSSDENRINSWINYTIEMLWNTLNAKLVDVNGGNDFKLSNLDKSDAIAEMEYYLNADGFLSCAKNDFENAAKELTANAIEMNPLNAVNGEDNQNETEGAKKYNAFCKGFMDLVFKKKDAEGNERYCILDWKSDYLEKYDALSVQTRVDEAYSIQRVLYSYCLIQWLKTFYADESENEIFEKYFGGIYYVLVRGTKADAKNGIYGKTWESFEQLKNAYNNIQNLIAQKV